MTTAEWLRCRWRWPDGSLMARIRPIQEPDLAGWLPLWDGYNAFYGRSGATALPRTVTDTTWARFFDRNEPVYALVAELDGRLVGLAHYRGIGRALIEGVYERAGSAGITRVYWQTQASNTAGRLLYDKVAKHAGFIVYSAEL